MTIANALTNLAAICRTDLTGVKTVFEHPPESISEGPSIVLNWLDGVGDLATSGDLSDDELTLRLLVVTPRKNLKEASAQMRPYVALVRNMLWSNASLNGACESVISWSFQGPGAIPYNGVVMFGIIFDVRLKFKDSVTYTL